MARYTCSMMCPSLKYYSNMHIHVLSCLPTLEISEGLFTPPAPHSSSIVHQAQDSVYLSCVPYLSLSYPQWSQSWLTALLQNDFLSAFLGFVPFFIFCGASMLCSISVLSLSVNEFLHVLRLLPNNPKPIPCQNNHHRPQQLINTTD